MPGRSIPLAFVLAVIGGCAQLDLAGDRIAAACERVIPLARGASLIPGIPASVAAYVIIGCETAQGIAKLRADPESAAWLARLEGELREALAKRS